MNSAKNSQADYRKTGQDNSLKSNLRIRNWNGFSKRGLDIVLALLAFLIAAPVIGVISALLWLESPGEVIFTQVRIGLHGKRFKMYKFRKFPVNWGDKGPAVTAARDSRMTFLGAILERLKFDELPQLWNIVKGEMSFVGPRPESCGFADMFQGRYADLLHYVPGIFGPNQIAFRNESSLYPPDEPPENYYRRVLFKQKAKVDLAYFKEANLFTDISWIIRGVWVSVAGAVNWRRFLKSDAPLVAWDIAAVLIAWSLAYVMRRSGWPEEADRALFFKDGLLSSGFCVAIFCLGGCYRQSARYFSMSDSFRLTLCASLACFASAITIITTQRWNFLYHLPITWFVLLPLIFLPRILIRIKWENDNSKNILVTKKIIIYGAGRVGKSLSCCIHNGGMIGFIDDDHELLGRRISGYPVIGHESDIPTIHDVHSFDQLWLSFKPDILKRYRLSKICKNRDIAMVIIPEIEPFAGMLTPIKKRDAQTYNRKIDSPYDKA
ncbi:MAG: sugar transferase [Syntrophobacteraceae bacterium]